MRHHDRHLIQTLKLLQAGANPLSLEEVKAHLRVESDDDDTLIESLMDTAQNDLDGRDGILGRALLTQRWQINRSHFAHAPVLGAEWRWRDRLWNPTIWRELQAIDLPLPPLQSVDSVKYIDTSGALQTLDPATYRTVDGGGDKWQILPKLGCNWPTHAPEPDAVQIQITCGYETVEALDQERRIIRQAMLLKIGIWYENREAALVADRAASVELPFGVRSMLTRHKVSLL